MLADTVIKCYCTFHVGEATVQLKNYFCDFFFTTHQGLGFYYIIYTAL